MSSILKVDTINEVTSANGVTVDGLSIKDSKLVTANSVVTTNITDANVTTAKITDANVTTAKIADVNVTEGKIADNAITLAKMASGTDGNIISYDASGNPVAVATGSAAQVLTSAGAGAPPTFATATVPDDAITLAKMAPGTDGNVISYDASGNPVAVATGSSGQVLTSAGAGAPPTFSTLPAGGSWVLIDTQTASGNPSTLEPGAVFSSTYDTYVLIIRRINLQSNGGLYLYVGTSSGFVTSGYRWAGVGGNSGGGSLFTGGGNNGEISLLGGTNSSYHVNTTQDCLSGVIWIHNPHNSYRTSIHGELAWENATDLAAQINTFSAHPNTNASYDRWKIAPSTGTFQSNTIIQTFGVINA